MAANKLIDASVVIAAYTEGNNAAQQLIKGSGKNYILSFTPLEVANGIRYSLKSKDIIETTLQKLYSKKFNFLECEQKDILLAAETALKSNTSVYDTLYHVIAIRLNLSFYTLDAKYYAKAKSLGNIVLLNTA